jgi:lipopolysaccharide/colanic/teichoic acid biosynthesis glycosyltransferase
MEQYVGKRAFDVVFSLIGIILASPVLVLASSLVKTNSKGPSFYKSRRVGRNGKVFSMYKFRTMVVGADKIGGPSTPIDDPRLTKIGIFLKKFQIDELPQLINVLKGEMSLVGPRPEVPVYVDMMSKNEKEKILSVRPGITDFASLWNFHEGEILKGAKDPEKAYMEEIRPEKLRLQMKYVEEMSFLTDIKIIFKTILKLFK